MTDAVLSSSRKLVICGDCGLPLCRRNREPSGMVAAAMGSRAYYHDLSWDTDWHLVDGHLERAATGQDRLVAGMRPVRRGFDPGEAPPTRRGFPDRPPAQCPRCGALNAIIAKRLDLG